MFVTFYLEIRVSLTLDAAHFKTKFPQKVFTLSPCQAKGGYAPIPNVLRFSKCTVFSTALKEPNRPEFSSSLFTVFRLYLALSNFLVQCIEKCVRIAFL